MKDRDAQVHSLISTNIAYLVCPEKGFRVAAYFPMFPRNILVEGLQTIQGYGIYHGPI
jgi:hypothetical protein